MSNSLIVLYQPFSIFSDEEIPLSIPELDNSNKKLLMSNLLFENFNLLNSNKSYDIMLLLNEKDKNNVPSVYDTINTKIDFYEDEKFVSNKFAEILNSEVKKVLILLANTYGISAEQIRFNFDMLSSENERIILNFTNDGYLNSVGLNNSKINLSDIFHNFPYLEKDIIRNSISLNCEVISNYNGEIVYTKEQFAKLLKYFKSSAFKTFNSNFILFLSTFFSKG